MAGVPWPRSGVPAKTCADSIGAPGVSTRWTQALKSLGCTCNHIVSVRMWYCERTVRACVVGGGVLAPAHTYFTSATVWT
jgi:hypothetical protein